MIDLKVGDRVSARNAFHDQRPHGAREVKYLGIVTRIFVEANAVEIRCGDNLRILHRWQVRKLVKVRKCDECNGIGTCKVDRFQGFAWGDGHYLASSTCHECNGKGKVKV